MLIYKSYKNTKTFWKIKLVKAFILLQKLCFVNSTNVSNTSKIDQKHPDLNISKP